MSEQLSDSERIAGLEATISAMQSQIDALLSRVQILEGKQPTQEAPTSNVTATRNTTSKDLRGALEAEASSHTPQELLDLNAKIFLTPDDKLNTLNWPDGYEVKCVALNGTRIRESNRGMFFLAQKDGTTWLMPRSDSVRGNRAYLDWDVNKVAPGAEIVSLSALPVGTVENGNFTLKKKGYIKEVFSG